MFGDGLGRAADSSFVIPQPLTFCLVLVFKQSNSHGNQQQLDVFKE